MTRQLEAQREIKESKRRDALVRTLEFDLVGTLQTQGIELKGFAVKFDEWECLLTLKADVNEKRHVAFVGGESVISCILKSLSAAQHNRLRWRVDVYTPSKT